MLDLISLFWLADIMNLPFMAMFDTVYELNEVFLVPWMDSDWEQSNKPQ